MVFQLVATDNDGDKLFYSINGDGANYFSVDRETGNVILKQTVDYEVRMVKRLEEFNNEGKTELGIEM